MTFVSKTCIEITCDGPGPCEPWDEGVPHFDTEELAVDYARDAGWLVVGRRLLCGQCAAAATCEATGHRWDDWHERAEAGIAYRKRWCGHCNEVDYDPPYKELEQRFRALRDAEDIVRAAGRAGDAR